jgi:nucleobase:cation symporter-1, NCS1 family
MATVTHRLGRLLEREAPAWGVEPIPPSRRSFSTLDLAVLWGDLSVGLLVIYTGAFLVPGLSLPTALAAIGIGTLLGCLPLAVVGAVGAREGVPTMSLFRPILGVRGSFVPSALNVAQLVGWTAFEMWAMATVAGAVTRRAFGVEAYVPWLVVVALVCTGLALGGPVVVVRRWLERFGVHLLLAVGLWITARLLSSGALEEIWRAPGSGMPFWLAVDLVIAMPVSWLPLVADYDRFARPRARAFAGTYVGYALGNIWFFALGALLVLAAGAAPDVLSIGESILALAGGLVVIAILIVGESDQAFANIYSSAVSVQNVAPRLSQRGLILAVGAIGFVLALWLREGARTYELFLLVIGSVFVPLFGVFLADLALPRSAAGRTAVAGPGVRWGAFVPWAAGFVAFHWCAPSPLPGWQRAAETFFAGWLGLPFPLFDASLGASIPSFAVAFSLAVVSFPLVRRIRRSGGR